MPVAGALGGALVAAAVVSISLLGLVRRVGRWNARRLVVTDRRALLSLGDAVAPGRRRCSLDALHDLQIHVSGPGRLLRYGCVIATTNGRRTPLLGLRRLPDSRPRVRLLLGSSRSGRRSSRAAAAGSAPAYSGA